jgi:hypothetical protein
MTLSLAPGNREAHIMLAEAQTLLDIFSVRPS